MCYRCPREVFLEFTVSQLAFWSDSALSASSHKCFQAERLLPKVITMQALAVTRSTTASCAELML